MITDETQDSNDESPDKTDADDGDSDILRVAKERFKLVQSAETEQRELTEEDLKFSNGEQWLEADLQSRREDGRPSLVINRMPGFIHQVSNDIRQNRPSIKVSPVDDAADVDTAKILQGIIRHIEYSSNADNAYDTATDSAIRGGYGYFRIITDFESPLSFNQEIKIKRVADRFAVSMDPSYQEPDGSDADWAFIGERIPLTSFKARYPKSKISTTHDFESVEAELGDWYEDNSVLVTEYFWKEYESVTIVLVDVMDPLTGQTTQQTFKTDDLPETLPDGSKVLGERETSVAKIRWAKLNGCEILEQTEWLGSWIPIIPVLGEELVINGKKYLSGVIRHAKDSQRMYNYWKSAETEAIANAPRAPYIGAEGSFEGHEQQWRASAKKNIPFLQFKPVIKNNQMMPPPQRQTFEPAIQAITNAAMMASEDMKATTSIYDAAMGAQSNEKSGVAIQRRANQAQTSNFHFVDNLSKSIKHAGRIIVELIPKIYDTARAIRILGEDNSEKIVRVNDMFKLADGQDKAVDLSKGKYDVTVSVGPSYETKRQEAVSSMLDLARSAPQVMQIAPDLIVGQMDWQGADEMAKRFKKMLPPNLQDEGQNKKDPQALEAQLGQQQQVMQQMTAQLNEMSEKLKTKSDEYAHKERMQARDLEYKATVELAKLQAADARLVLTNQIQQQDRVSNQALPSEIEAEQLQQQQIQQAQMQQQSGPIGAEYGAAPMQQQQQLPGELPPEFSMENP